LQIFEDGASYRGRLKTMAREVVKFYYKDAFNSDIEHCHNSDQRDNAISKKIKKLIDESLFLQGPPDIEVNSSPSF
jgi:hypothetical protein